MNGNALGVVKHNVGAYHLSHTSVHLLPIVADMHTVKQCTRGASCNCLSRSVMLRTIISNNARL